MEAILISLFPMIVIIVIWIILMRKMKLPQNQTVEYQKQYIEIAERIAVSLEKMAKK